MCIRDRDWSVLNKNIVCQALRHDTLLHWTITRNVRNKCLTNLSWVIGIVVEGWRWNVWNQAVSYTHLDVYKRQIISSSQ